jgi:hypothetical protein
MDADSVSDKGTRNADVGRLPELFVGRVWSVDRND